MFKVVFLLYLLVTMSVVRANTLKDCEGRITDGGSAAWLERLPRPARTVLSEVPARILDRAVVRSLIDGSRFNESDRPVLVLGTDKSLVTRCLLALNHYNLAKGRPFGDDGDYLSLGLFDRKYEFNKSMPRNPPFAPHVERVINGILRATGSYLILDHETIADRAHNNYPALLLEYLDELRKLKQASLVVGLDLADIEKLNSALAPQGMERLLSRYDVLILDSQAEGRSESLSQRK